MQQNVTLITQKDFVLTINLMKFLRTVWQKSETDEANCNKSRKKEIKEWWRQKVPVWTAYTSNPKYCCRPSNNLSVA